MTTKKSVSVTRTKSGTLKKSAVKKAVRAISSKVKSVQYKKKSVAATKKAAKSATSWTLVKPPKKNKTTKTSTSPSRTKTGRLKQAAVRNAVKATIERKKAKRAKK